MLGKSSRAYDCTVVRVTGPEWLEYDAYIENDMFACCDRRGRQVELWPKTGAVPYHSRDGLVYLFGAEPAAVVRSSDLATLEERVPFYALNQPTQDRAGSLSTIVSLVSLGVLVIMMVWVHGAASDASGAKAAVELLYGVVTKK